MLVFRKILRTYFMDDPKGEGMFKMQLKKPCSYELLLVDFTRVTHYSECIYRGLIYVAQKWEKKAKTKTNQIMNEQIPDLGFSKVIIGNKTKG